MPKQKNATRKKSSVRSSGLDSYVSHEPDPITVFPVEGQRKGSSGSRLFLISGFILLFILGLLLFRKGYIVAAIVNGKPILYFQLQSVVMNRFGKQALEGMVSEVLIADAAAKSGIAITNEEVVAKESELLKSFGGQVSIDEVLKFQGITKQEFDKQVRLQLTVAKILEKDIVIGESDIDVYIKTNKANLQATDAALLRQEARSAIAAQKVGEKIQPWFTELKDKAKILRFLQ